MSIEVQLDSDTRPPLVLRDGHTWMVTPDGTLTIQSANGIKIAEVNRFEWVSVRSVNDSAAAS